MAKIKPESGKADKNPEQEPDETFAEPPIHHEPAPAPILDRENVEVEVVDNGIRGHFFRPAIICGRCEHCGSRHYVGGQVTKRTLKDGEVDYQYTGGYWEEMDATTCKHYKGLPIACTYCGEKFTGQRNKLGQFNEILATRLVWVISFNDQPNRLIMYCDSFDCKKKHLDRIRNSII